jgi:aminoglycoside/choline kinase family phosphotransferase
MTRFRIMASSTPGFGTVSPSEDTVVSGVGGLTIEWLNRVLSTDLGPACVTGLDVTPVGTGQVSDSARLTVTYDRPVQLPNSFVAKVPSDSETSRGAAKAIRTYEIEAHFYAQLRPAVTAHVPTCFHAAWERSTDFYVVLLEDLAPARQGDQLAGVTVAEASAATRELAMLHGQFWDEPSLAGVRWLSRNTPQSRSFVAEFLGSLFGPFRERYGSRLSSEALEVITDFEHRLPDYLSEPLHAPTLTHSDFRADNLLFGGPRVAILDWQSASCGPGPADLSYFLGSSLPTETRRSFESELVREYHSDLLAAGVDFSWDACWTSYRRHTYQGVLTAVGASMLVERTDRGDDMFCTMATRHAIHAKDLESARLISC